MADKVSNAEIEARAEEVFELVRTFGNPKDAAATFVLAYLTFMKAAFPPEDHAKAFESIDAFARLIKEGLKEGWQ